MAPLILLLLLIKATDTSSASFCGARNPIDDCWHCDSDWHLHRQRLADCAMGFGSDARGGQGGEIYVVTDPSDENAVPGTLRHAVIQKRPLWIIFAQNMSIKLSSELMIKSFKTIDGRGASVEISHGPCLTIHNASNVIIHGISIHDCTGRDGDGIRILGSSNVWVDHCSLWNCHDGLIDATRGSTALTFSNNYFSKHVKVMLLGHSNKYPQDTMMQATIVYNHFGPGCIERMPRCRFGNFHVVNNDYSEWGMYAIGGSANPTINVEGNRFLASNKSSKKQVTKRIGTAKSTWIGWNWRSANNLFVNGAYFVPSGQMSGAAYARAWSLDALPAESVGALTASAGALSCAVGRPC